MSKENHQEQVDFSLFKKYYSQFPEEIDAIISNKFALKAAEPLLKKVAEFKIKPVPKKNTEIHGLLVKLRSIYNTYFLALEEYRKLPDQNEYQIRESLFATFNNLKMKMTEENRKLYNDGSRLIHGIYPEDFGRWAAIHSYNLNLLKEFSPENESLKDKSDPFFTYLKFYEEGVKPLYFQDKFYVHISLAKEQGIIRCWTPRDGYNNSYFNPKNMECNIRDKKTVAKKIIISQNKTNAQNQFRFNSPSRQQSTV